MNKEMKERIGNEHLRRVKLICKSNLSGGIIAQVQVLRTIAIKANKDKQPVSPKCRMLGTWEETFMHLQLWK